MSRQQPPPFARKTSAPWDRLRPVKQDPLESMGYISKGDNRLLDFKVQESFYQKIVDRYMQFCTHHKHNLDKAFAALSLNNDHPESPDPNNNLAVKNNASRRQNPSVATSSGLGASKWATPSAVPDPPPPPPNPADEMSTILMALRKLREALLATSRTATSPVFSQQVHMFNIRVAILALHPPSYHPSLSYLLTVLHTKQHPLENSGLKEMTTYTILDLALRQNDLVAAYTLRHNSRKRFGYTNKYVDAILSAVVAGNWVVFWRIRSSVDGYTRALMHWHVETLRKSTLKIFGRAYLKTDLKWLLRSAGGNELNWDEIVQKEGVGWMLDGCTVVIRKPKIKT